MSKHTPGPWTYSEGVEPKGVFHVYVNQDDDGEVKVAEAYTQQAARLIAAAPDLLAALEAIHDSGIETILAAVNAGDTKLEAALDMVEAAIAKARGEA